MSEVRVCLMDLLDMVVGMGILYVHSGFGLRETRRKAGFDVLK